MPNTAAPTLPHLQRARRGTVFYLLTITALAGLAIILTVVTLQWKAARQVDAELARLRAQGLPTDNESLAQWFEQNSSKEATLIWDKVLDLVGTNSPWSNYIRQQRLRLVDLDDDEFWKTVMTSPGFDQYLSDMQPVIDRIEIAAQSPKPVWMPVAFRGPVTLLGAPNETRVVVQLLACDVRYKLKQQDPEGAFRSLLLIPEVASAFDWNFSGVTKAIYVANMHSFYSLIQETMPTDAWSDAQLNRLREIATQPLEIEQNLRETLIANRVQAFEWSTSSAHVNAATWRLGDWRPTLPSYQLQVLRAYSRSLERVDMGWDWLEAHRAELIREENPLQDRWTNTDFHWYIDSWSQLEEARAASFLSRDPS
jgi:hypothetical protein